MGILGEKSSIPIPRLIGIEEKKASLVVLSISWNISPVLSLQIYRRITWVDG